jgi:processive 1,2-diacylglycerol beta-glucosyltransferase
MDPEVNQVTMFRDNSTPNILVISASIGSGHTQAAKALESALRLQSPGAVINSVDFMSSEHSLINAMIKHTYVSMLHSLPDVYDSLYRWSDAVSYGSKVQSLLSGIMKKSLQELVELYQPDLLLFTHPFPCGTAAALKKSGRLRALLAGVITDFAVHRLWVYPEVDFYFAPSTSLRQELSFEGIDEEKIYAMGIPVAQTFEARSRSTASAETQDGKPIILIMGGGLGLGHLDQTIRVLSTLPLPIHIVAVAGQNEELTRSLRELAPALPQKLTVFDYTDRIPELMASASLLITKPGALTCSEALVAKLPIILFQPLPGQEYVNAHYLSKNKAALPCDTDDQLRETSLNLLTNKPFRSSLLKNAESLRYPHAAINISNVLLSHMKGRCPHEASRTSDLNYREPSAASS